MGAMVERDAKGRILPGSRLGPGGRRTREREIEYQTILHEECTPEEWRQICKEQIAKAKLGHMKSVNWLSDRLLGKPTQHIRSDGEAMPEWLMMVLQVQPKQVNESDDIALLNGSYIELSSLTDGDGLNNPASEEGQEGE
jgi:hypothetical protein